MNFLRLHHTQLSMPTGEENGARAFYSRVLGMAEVPKPDVLAARGGVWFTAGGVELHLGIQTPFVPATRAHPAILVDDLNALAERLQARGHETIPDDNFPGHRRFYANDPFGNRLEFLQQD